MVDKNFVKNARGFTLAEVIIALGIMSILLVAIYGVSAAASRSATKNEVAAEVMQNLRTSMDFMEQDIRMAGLDRFGLAGAGIARLSAPILMPSALWNWTLWLGNYINMNNVRSKGSCISFLYETIYFR